MSLEKAIATLGIPGSIAVAILIVFALLQLVGELIELCGKVAPAFLKVRKVVQARKERNKETQETLKEIKEALKLIQPHCDETHIAERNEWMSWVNGRAQVYDNTIIEYGDRMDKLTDALNSNTRMTEQMFAETSRDRIIDFASKVSNPLCYVSREEFHRIFKVYDKYEQFLEAHNMTNGEVELNYQIIQENYRERTNSHNFIDDRLYTDNTPR